MSPYFLDVKDLQIEYPVYGGLFRKVVGKVHAVNGVSIQIKEGEIAAIIGESGCGKSSLAHSLLGLIEPISGSIRFRGRDVFGKNIRETRNKDFYRSFQMIFQDPYSALNPRHTVFEILAEPLLYHKIVSKDKVRQRIASLLKQVGLSPRYIDRYPYSFSGGQRQRICIARAVSLNPKFIVCDEITAALDISVQAQIVRLLFQLKKELGLTLLWISHDLSLIRSLSDTVHIMHAGRIVEQGLCKDVLHKPSHPYTDALLKAVPSLEIGKRPSILQGEPPSTSRLLEDCSFAARCPGAQEKCRKERPVLELVSSRKTSSRKEGKSSETTSDKKTQEPRVACFFPL